MKRNSEAGPGTDEGARANRGHAARPAVGGPRRADAGDLALPHERDEVPGAEDVADAPGGPRAIVDQAARDIRRGLIDTEARGVPTDVPGPARAPERSDGAALPPEGVRRSSHRRRKPDGTPGD